MLYIRNQILINISLLRRNIIFHSTVIQQLQLLLSVRYLNMPQFSGSKKAYAHCSYNAFRDNFVELIKTLEQNTIMFYSFVFQIYYIQKKRHRIYIFLQLLYLHLQFTFYCNNLMEHSFPSIIIILLDKIFTFI